MRGRWIGRRHGRAGQKSNEDFGCAVIALTNQKGSAGRFPFGGNSLNQRLLRLSILDLLFVLFDSIFCTHL
jgi:hypothetical protein